mmetsp:Transcript_28083/g.50172  ORF Transcript_28083/g.50172 Transcript_28083/m.50172 type:complete len:1011 (-) Transcript_28083:109-3141(-)
MGHDEMAEDQAADDEVNDQNQEIRTPVFTRQGSNLSQNPRRTPSQRRQVVLRTPRGDARGKLSCESAYLMMHAEGHDVLEGDMKKLVMDGIRGSRFCKDLSNVELDAISMNMEYFVFQDEQAIISQGQDGDHFFVASLGHLEVTISGTVARIMGAGESFGDIALLYNCPRTATVSAKGGKVGVWAVGAILFRQILQEHAILNQAENLRMLEKVSLLDGLSGGQKSRIGAMALLNESIQANFVVCCEGEKPTALYVVKSGTMKVAQGGTRSPTGELDGGTTLATLSAGQCFGEKELASGCNFEASLVADTNCELVCVSSQKLAELLGDDVAGQLEKAYVGSVLGKASQFKNFTAPQRTHMLATEVVFETLAASTRIADSRSGGLGPSLIVVVDGELKKTGDDEGALARGGWCQDYLLDELGLIGDATCSDEGRGCFRPDSLMAGPSGAKVAFLPIRGIVQGISGQPSAPETSLQEIVEYLRKILILRKVPIFKGLAEQQIDSLSKALVSTDWDERQVVFEKGTKGDAFFIISSGAVTIDPDGDLNRTLKRGACFGERALLFSEPRSAKVIIAEKGTRLWSAQRDVFEQFVTKNMRDDLVQRANLLDWTLSMKNLKHVRLVGAGSFGSVRLVEHVKTEARYALKRIRKEDGQVPEDVVRECALLAEVSHPFVLQLVKTFETVNSIYILTELITGGELYAQMNERMGVVSRKHAQFYIGSLVLIMEALHQHGIIYRDLKPENVMLDAQGYLKLVDFGLAKKLDGAQKTFSVVGTIYYMAPEVITAKGYSFEADFWSLGVMLFELVCGGLPFGEECADDGGVVAAVIEEDLEFPARYNDNSGKKLIEGLLTKNPAGRLGAQGGWTQVKEHKFFKELGNTGKADLFTRILHRDQDPPFVPQREQYSQEDSLNEKVTLSDAEELADHWAEQAKVRIGKIFKKFDLDGNGTIEIEEFCSVLATADPERFGGQNADAVNVLMASIDKNGDGLIDFQEFFTFMCHADVDTDLFDRVLNE